MKLASLPGYPQISWRRGDTQPYMVRNPSDLGNSCNLSTRPGREVAWISQIWRTLGHVWHITISALRFKNRRYCTASTSIPLYRDGKKGMQVLLSNSCLVLPAVVKQQKEEISRHHVPSLFAVSVPLRYCATATMRARRKGGRKERRRSSSLSLTVKKAQREREGGREAEEDGRRRRPANLLFIRRGQNPRVG